MWKPGSTKEVKTPEVGPSKGPVMLTLPLPARRGEEAAAVGAGPPGQGREGRRAAPLFGKEE